MLEQFSNVLVSIIIPVYNAEKFVSEALESCLQQTHQYIEIICVDNNSTDNSKIILERYHKNYPEIIRVFTETTPGAPAARNRGIKETRGEFVHFLDADDALFPDAIESLIGHMKDGIDATCGGENYYYSNFNGDYAYERPRIKNDDLQFGDIISDSPNTGSTLLKKTIIREVKWDESLKSEQEIVFWSQLCLENNAKFKFTTEKVCKIRIHNSPNRISNQGKKIKAYNKYIAILKIDSLLENSPYKSQSAIISFNNFKLQHAFNSIYARNFKVSKVTSAKVNKKLIPKSKHFKKFSREGITYLSNHYIGFIFHYLCTKILGKTYLKSIK